jgi:hypothetical protein
MFTKTPKLTTFNSAYYLVIGCLLAVSFMLIILTSLQSPRIRQVSLDIPATTSYLNQQLFLRFSLPIAHIKASQVSIEPATTFTIANRGDIAAIQFSSRLSYHSTYHVRIANLTDAFRSSRKLNFNYSFTTLDPTIYYIHRYPLATPNPAKKRPDAIMQTSLHGDQSTVIYSAPEIADYVVVGKYMIVSSINPDATNSLYAINIQTKQVRKISLPATGAISELQSSPGGRFFGFRLLTNVANHGKQFQNALFTYDTYSDQLGQVRGVNGSILGVVNWLFAPDNRTMLVQTFDSCYLIDVFHTNPIVPLGQFSSISNFSYDGSRVGLSTLNGPLILNIVTGQRTPVPLITIANNNTINTDSKLLNNEPGSLNDVDDFNSSSKTYSEDIVITRQNIPKVLYMANLLKTSIVDFEASPNDQYVVVGQASLDNSAYDNYAQNPEPTNIQTRIIDSTTGKILKTINGFKLTWR